MQSSRDQMVVATVQRLGYVSRVGLERAYFQSERTAQRVLARLTKTGHLRRTERLGPAIYHLGRWEAQAEHRAAVSDAILLLRPHRWKLEVPVPGTRAKADALLLKDGHLLDRAVKPKAAFILHRLPCLALRRLTEPEDQEIREHGKL